MATPHNSAEKGAFGKAVLMPGSTGTSEKSNFKNGGMKGSGISRYMSTTARAVMMAVQVILVIITLRVDTVVVEISDIKKQLLPSGLYRRPRDLTVSVPP